MVDRTSLAVCRLRFIRNDLIGNQVGSAIGTGSFWLQSGQWYIVTNWHNVTGVNPDTNLLMGEHTPNKLVVGFHFGRALEGSKRVMYHEDDALDLYKDDQPVW